jgi:predicted lipoprotein with Yx(FWY)xxD motif
MRFTIGRASGRSWAARAAVAALLVSGSTAAATGIAAQAQAQTGMAAAGSSGHSLYEHPNGSCSASCQSIWPPLLMPAGTTIPKGASCLKTAKLGTGLQVTYHGQRLYTFTGDSGHSVNGNGVAGFVVAKVTTACP